MAARRTKKKATRAAPAKTPKRRAPAKKSAATRREARPRPRPSPPPPPRHTSPSRPARLDAAILEAASGGHLEAARLLLDAGADANARDATGASALALAVPAGVALVRLLLAHGASPDSPFVRGMTALHRAVDAGKPDVVAALLDAGADPNLEDSAGMTPLHAAAHRSLEGPMPPECIDLLVARGARTEGGSNHSTPLLCAAADGQLEHVQRLLAHGADVNAVTAGGGRKTALHLAFARGDDAMARVLVEQGADRSRRDHTGLDLATVYGPWGEDIRAVELDYAPSAALQRLDVHVRFCVLHPAHLANLARADFDAATWAALIEDGVAGGELFPPEAGRAVPLASVGVGNIAEPGVYDRMLSLDVAGVAPAFLEAMARTILGTPTTTTGATPFAALRVVGVRIAGSKAGALAADAASLVRRVRERLPLGAFADGALRVPLEVLSGRDPSLRIVASAAVTDADARAILRHAQSWLAMQGTWRTTREFDGAPVTLLARAYSPASPSLPLARLGKGGAEAKAFPYEVASARATLANAMRSLAAKVPLAEVVLTVPEAIC